MKKIKFILQGFLNLLLIKIGAKIDDTEYIKMVIHRQRICKSCSHHKSNIGICNICGCYCRAKASVEYDLDKDGKSIDGCPLKKW